MQLLNAPHSARHLLPQLSNHFVGLSSQQLVRRLQFLDFNVSLLQQRLDSFKLARRFFFFELRDFELALQLSNPSLSVCLRGDVNVFEGNYVDLLPRRLVLLQDTGWRGEVAPELTLVGVELLHAFNTVEHGAHESPHILERLNQLGVLVLQLTIDLLLLVQLQL